MSGTVFISHSMNDQGPVAYVRGLVEAHGLKVYLAEHDPQPGRVLADKVRRNILACDAALVLLTHASIDSRYVHQEIGVAQGAGKLIVPLVHPELIDEDLAMLDGLELLVFDPDHPGGSADLVGQLKRIADRANLRDALVAMTVAALVVGLLYVALSDGATPSAG